MNGFEQDRYQRNHACLAHVWIVDDTYGVDGIDMMKMRRPC